MSVPARPFLWACLFALTVGCGVDQLVGLDATDTDVGLRDGGRRDGGDDDGDGGDEVRSCIPVLSDAGWGQCPLSS